MHVRKSILLTTLAAVALLPLSINVAVASAAASHDVLTTGKVGGTNVSAGAILTASLAPKAKATFTSTSHGFTITLTCTRASFTDKVVTNPAKSGTATVSVTKETVSGCTANNKLVKKVKSAKLNKLPYASAISDSKGNPVTVSGPSTTIVVQTTDKSVGTLSCTFAAKTITGSASNTSQTIAFSKQVFKLTAGSSLCGKTGKFSATFGPVVDTSVKGSPHVYVN